MFCGPHLFRVICLLTGIALIEPASLSAAEPLRIVTLGDSITKGVRTGVAADQTFSAILQELLKQDGLAVEVINVGIGGERTDQAVQRFARDVTAKSPTIVAIMYGANDSYIDVGQTAPRLTLTDFRKHTESLVQMCRDAGIQPILMTEPRQGDKHPGNGAGEHPNLRLVDYLDLTRDVAQDLDVPLIDHYADWTAAFRSGTDIETWMTDHIHPSPAGHQRMAETMRPLVGKLLRAKK